MVKEPNCETFYSMPNNIIFSDDYSQYYEQKTFDGRTNRLSFKLCHKYCKTCKEYGLSDDEQNCEIPTII